MNESTNDRSAIGRHADRILSVPADTWEQVQRRAAENAQSVELDRVAASLPDGLFDAHPDVVRLTDEIRIREMRAQQLVTHRRSRISEVGALIADLTNRQKVLNESIAEAALDEALASEFEFKRTRVLLEKRRETEELASAARIALEMLEQAQPHRPNIKLDAALLDLANLLRALKRAHVRASAGD